MKRKKLTLLIGSVAVLVIGLALGNPENLQASLVLLWMGLAE